MRNILVIFLLTLGLGFFGLQPSQAQVFTPLNEVPSEIIYFPSAGADQIVRVVYARPAKNNRSIFGDVVPYGEKWPAEGEQAPEIVFYNDVNIGGKKCTRGCTTCTSFPRKIIGLSCFPIC